MTKIKKDRIWEIDFIRGVLIILMIFDHFMFDFAYFGDKLNFSPIFMNKVMLPIYNFSLTYWNNPVRIAIREVVITTFVLISGISVKFSNNNFIRTVKIIIFCLLITSVFGVASEISGEGYYIDYNIFHVLATAMIIFLLIKNRPNYYQLIVGLGILAFSFIIPELHITTDTKFLLPFGILPPNYFFNDYLAFFPIGAFFFIGSFLSTYLYKEKKSLIPIKSSNPINFLGRYSLYVYVLHQIILFVFFYILIWTL